MATVTYHNRVVRSGVLRKVADLPTLAGETFGHQDRSKSSHPLSVTQLKVLAGRLPPEEAERELAHYARRYPTAARALARLMGFQVEDVEADFPALSRQLPLIAFRPRRPAQ